MEKIYMEDMGENKKNKRQTKKKFNSKTTIASLVMAAILIVTVVVVGFTGNSYAIPDVSYNLPDTFTSKVGEAEYQSDTGFSVIPYFTDGDIQVFCLEHGVNFPNGTLYSKGEQITDYGLLYLMANVYPNKDFSTFADDGLQTWLSQVAIWMYLYTSEDLLDNGQLDNSVTGTSPNYIAPEDLTKIKEARGVILYDGGDLVYHTMNPATGGVSNGGVTADDPLLYDTIEDLVNRALSNRTVPNKTLTINYNNDISVTQDNKYYQTSVISVVGSPSDNFNGFELKIDKAPEGTFVVDANGQEIKDLSNLTATDKLYLRTPIDKVTEDNKSINFSVTGSFKTYEGHYYVADGAQTITSVNTVNNNISKGAEIPLNYTPKVPDTGMSTAQTIYFIGLIILLSGVGIIYANVKPGENK
ncbi:MAG: hypothetical protein PUC82_05555 [bacterium]|nr:hypothetical protein [bacterium]